MVILGVFCLQGTVGARLCIWLCLCLCRRRWVPVSDITASAHTVSTRALMTVVLTGVVGKVFVWLLVSVVGIAFVMGLCYTCRHVGECKYMCTLVGGAKSSYVPFINISSLNSHTIMCIFL